MKNRGRRGLEAEIAAIAAQTAVICKSFRVPSAADLVIRLIEISETCDEVALLIALKSRPRDDVEDAVSSIPIVRVITAPLDFHIIDVLGIELRPHIAGNIRVRNRYSVPHTAHLVSAADLQ